MAGTCQGTINITIPCVPLWTGGAWSTCTSSGTQTRTETDGCGNTRTATQSCTPPCVPNWQCHQPLDHYMSDGCGNTQLNSTCDPPSTGSIAISSSPVGAKIFVNNYDMGVTTPRTLDGWTTGQASITLKLNGYQNHTTVVNVVAGTTVTVSATLLPVSLVNQVCYRGAAIFYGTNSVISSPVWTYCLGTGNCDFTYQSSNNINPQGWTSIAQAQGYIDALIALAWTFNQC